MTQNGSLEPENVNPVSAKQKFEELTREMVEVKAKMADIQFDIESAKDDMAPYDAVIEEAKRKIREAMEAKSQTEEKLRNLKWDEGSLRARLSRLEREAHKAEMEAIKSEEWAKRSAEIDELAKLYPWFGAIKKHQFEAAKQAVVLGGKMVLGDKRGLGKSLTSLATADLLKSKKLVIISKGEILRNMEHEVKKWAPNRTMLSIVSETRQYRDFVVDNVFTRTDEWTLLVNFEAWWRDKTLIRRIAKLQPDTIIIDEAHHAKEPEKNNFRGIDTLINFVNKCPECNHNDIQFIGNPDKFACKKCNFLGGRKDFQSVKHVIPMTGSPIMNRPEEFYALLAMIDKERFPDKYTFLRRYCRQEYYTNLMGKEALRWVFQHGGAEELLKQIGPQFIQRDKYSAGVDIPDQEFQFHYLDFDPEKYPRQYQTYQDLVKYLGVLFDSEDNHHVVATQGSTLIMRMRQVASWPMGIKIRTKDESGVETIHWQCDVNESVKIDKAFELTQELVGEGERVVIFSKFTAVLEELKRRFDETLGTDEKLRAAIYYGKTPNHVRDEIKLDFDVSTYDPENYKFDVVLCQYQSAGEGLNFNSATQTIFIEREWNPEKEGQATGRTNRMGQTRKTQVHILQLNDTIDIDIENLLADKTELVTGFEENADAIRRILEASRRNS